MPTSRVTWFAAALAVLALALTACGGDDTGGAAQNVSTADTDAPAGEIAVSDDLGATPTFEVPTDRTPPDELVVEDVVEGDGDQAQAGDTVVVHYVGKAWSSGQPFDASWDRGEPFEFELGAGRVIPGWDEGVAGMRVGGRRLLIIPPHLAYGESGAGDVIGPGETLVFVVDLLELR